jgi:hypothetical protein
MHNKSLKPTLVRLACSREWEGQTESLRGFGRQGGLTLCYAPLSWVHQFRSDRHRLRPTLFVS